MIKAKNQIQIKGRKDKGDSEDTLEEAKRVFKDLLKDNRKVLLCLIRLSREQEVKEVREDLYYTIDDEDEVRQNKDKELLLTRLTKRETVTAVADLCKHTMLLPFISKPSGTLSINLISTLINSRSCEEPKSAIPEVVVMGFMYINLSFAEVELIVNIIQKRR